MDYIDYILQVYFDKAEEPDIQGNGFFIDKLFITAAHILKVYVAPCILVNGRTYALSKEPSLFVSYFED